MNWLIGHQTIQGTLSLLHVLVYNLLNVKTSSDDAIQCYYIENIMYAIEIMLDINCDVWEFYITNCINLILILNITLSTTVALWVLFLYSKVIK